ncbi:MAG: ATP synthase subunit I [Oligoflexia bacterium]|nr:ATP synthase subunit I [Oligoflexia bacterium]
MPSLKGVFKTQALMVAVCGIILFFVDASQIFGFLAGAFLITLNFALLSLLWRRILDKKPVAITIGILVTKYAILGLLLYYYIMELKLSLVPLFVGIASLVGSFLITGLQTAISDKRI